jgi:hypothetical protein
VLDGLGKLGSAFDELPGAVASCAAAADGIRAEAPKLTKALRSLQNPVNFAFHARRSFVVNNAEIFREVEAAVGSYTQGQWHDFGRSTGDILFKVFTGGEGTGLRVAKDDPRGPQVLKGVLEGFGVTKELHALQDCLRATQDEIEEVQGAVELLEKKNAHDALNGLGKLGKSLENVPQVIDTCEAATDDVKADATAFHQALETLKHPLSFAYHVGSDLMVNGNDIMRDVEQAIDEYQQKKWEDFGKAMGKALIAILIGKESKDSLLV